MPGFLLGACVMLNKFALIAAMIMAPCIASAQPPPVLYWLQQQEMQAQLNRMEQEQRYYQLQQQDRRYYGNSDCAAYSSYGNGAASCQTLMDQQWFERSFGRRR
jgi:hypothetical protein